MRRVKRLIIPMIMAVLITVSFTACIHVANVESKVMEDQQSMMITLEQTLLWQIVYHKETKVMYMLRTDGGVTVMVDADGNPLLYEEE